MSRGRRVGGLVIGLTLVAGCGFLDPVEIEVDEEAMRQVESELDLLRSDFDALPTPPGAIADGATELDGRFEDSGQVTQPSAVRSWTFDAATRSRDVLEATPRALAAGQAVADAMTADGWKITEPITRGSWIALALEASTGDSTIHAQISVFDERMFLSAVVPGLLPCRLG